MPYEWWTSQFVYIFRKLLTLSNILTVQTRECLQDTKVDDPDQDKLALFSILGGHIEIGGTKRIIVFHHYSENIKVFNSESHFLISPDFNRTEPENEFYLSRTYLPDFEFSYYQFPFIKYVMSFYTHITADFDTFLCKVYFYSLASFAKSSTFSHACTLVHMIKKLIQQGYLTPVDTIQQTIDLIVTDNYKSKIKLQSQYRILRIPIDDDKKDVKQDAKQDFPLSMHELPKDKFNDDGLFRCYGLSSKNSKEVPENLDIHYSNIRIISPLDLGFYLTCQFLSLFVIRLVAYGDTYIFRGLVLAHVFSCCICHCETLCQPQPNTDDSSSYKIPLQFEIDLLKDEEPSVNRMNLGIDVDLVEAIKSSERHLVLNTYPKYIKYIHSKIPLHFLDLGLQQYQMCSNDKVTSNEYQFDFTCTNEHSFIICPLAFHNSLKHFITLSPDNLTQFNMPLLAPGGGTRFKLDFTYSNHMPKAIYRCEKANNARVRIIVYPLHGYFNSWTFLTPIEIIYSLKYIKSFLTIKQILVDMILCESPFAWLFISAVCERFSRYNKYEKDLTQSRFKITLTKILRIFQQLSLNSSIVSLIWQLIRSFSRVSLNFLVKSMKKSSRSWLSSISLLMICLFLPNRIPRKKTLLPKYLLTSMHFFSQKRNADWILVNIQLFFHFGSGTMLDNTKSRKQYHLGASQYIRGAHMFFVFQILVGSISDFHSPLLSQFQRVMKQFSLQLKTIQICCLDV